MKTAVCFTGTGRSLEHTYDNICKMLLDPLGDCDVFAFIPKTSHASKSISLLENNNLKKLVIEEESPISEEGLKFFPNWPPPTTTTQIYLKMIQSRKKINEMLSSYESYNEFEYDRVIFSRLDVVYYTNVSEILENYSLQKLMIPDFHNTFGGNIDGYNDRFAVGNRQLMSCYLDLYDSIKPHAAAGGMFQAEYFLKSHLLAHGIQPRKIPVRFGRIRENGEEIDTRLKNEILEDKDT